jgi:phenylpropionate dioxygenase-like ring-hydroxylating dioxygenase large terminal subunit
MADGGTVRHVLSDAYRVGPDGFVPKERYTTRVFLDLEMQRLWPRVWQPACREEQVPAVGDYTEYTIGEQSVLIVRAGPDDIRAHHNACLHRGTRLATGAGTFTGDIRCRYHAWEYALDGRLTKVVDRDEFGEMPSDLCLATVRCERWGGFVWINLDGQAPPLLDYLGPLPKLLGPYHLDRLRMRAYRSTILPANWKSVIDAFNEGYHVQGTHPQLLPWTDDVGLEYEPLGIHSHYGRIAGASRQLRPSPRLGLAEGEWDEGDILANMVAGLGGLFYGEEEQLVEELRAAPVPEGETLLGRYQSRRRALLEGRGMDVTGLTDDQLTSADDVFWFPNMVGPLYPGTAILFRVRPNGLDPHSAIKDTWILGWPTGEVRRPSVRFYPDWTQRDWGEITNQDYANMAEVQAGMRSSGFRGLRLNPRQESNVLHMHRVIDALMFDDQSVART